MFLDFYGFSQQPFGVTPDTRMLYLGRSHAEAIASLYCAIESGRGFAALIAKPGMGKTLVLWHLLSKLPNAHTAFIFQTQCDSAEFMQMLLKEFGCTASGDQQRSHDAFQDFAARAANEGRRLVVFIDEAQNLNETVLETIRLLSDFETPRTKLLDIVLSGQPGLAEMLNRNSMAQLRQRISTIAPLLPFSEAEVASYVGHRLAAAGGKPTVFTSAAIASVAACTHGIPRNINNVCFQALTLGCALRLPVVDEKLIADVVADLDLTPLLADAQAANDSASTVVGRATGLDTPKRSSRVVPIAPAPVMSFPAAVNQASARPQPMSKAAPVPSGNVSQRSAPRATVRTPGTLAPSFEPANQPARSHASRSGISRVAPTGSAQTAPPKTQSTAPRGLADLRPQSPPPRRLNSALVAPLAGVLMLAAVLAAVGLGWTVAARTAPATSPESRAVTAEQNAPATETSAAAPQPPQQDQRDEANTSAVQDSPVVPDRPRPRTRPRRTKPASNAPAAEKTPAEIADQTTFIGRAPVPAGDEAKAEVAPPQHPYPRTPAPTGEVVPAVRSAIDPDTLHSASATEVTNANAAASTPPPVLLSQVEPEYPEAARSMGIEGDVALRATIDPNGRVARVQVISGPEPLAAAAADAVRQWRYTANADQRSSAEETVTVSFRLMRNGSEGQR